MSEQILDAALLWYAAGACVLPAADDGTKRPGLSGWKNYQRRRPDVAALATWFAPPQAQGLGVVCGKVSGFLELLELEGRAMDEGVFTEATAACDALGLGEVWQRITTGYVQESPAGGRHLFYRIADGSVPGNTKIARRPASIDELDANPGERIKVLIETRGEGGWVVCAPSGGPTHPSGRAWRVECGTPMTIPTITLSERDELVRVLRSLDRCPVSAPAPAPRLAGADDDAGLRPGDDFEARTCWEDILLPHGWTVAYRAGSTVYWRRPGKTIGQSATTGRAADRDRLFVFSSSTPFEQEIPYTKFGAYAVLEHGGDFAAAAKALAGQGYGAAITAGTGRQAALIADLLPAGVTPAPAQAAAAVAALPANPGEADVAAYVAACAAAQLRYCPEMGIWYVWDGRCWQQQTRDGAQFGWAEWGCRQVPNPKGLLKWTAVSTIEGVERAMRRCPALRTGVGEWDCDPNLLNTPAGVLDLATGQMIAHDADLKLTRITGFEVGPAEPAPRFFQFLAETFLGDRQLMDYVQTLLGYTLFGHNREQIFIVCHGSGRNGKSLLLNTVMKVMGTYADKGDSDWLMVRRNGGHTTEIATMLGVRFMYFSEIGEFNRLDERRVKELSGGERVRFRRLYQEYGSFEPAGTMALICNDLPRVSQGGDSLHRRIRAIEFRNQVPAGKVDPQLPELFVTPDYGRAVMGWLVAGALRYLEQGLVSPPQVLAAGEAFRRASSGPVAEFVEDLCVVGGGAHQRIATAELYQAYVRWCNAQGEEPGTLTLLTRTLTRSYDVGKGFDASGTRRCYTNICLKEGR